MQALAKPRANNTPRLLLLLSLILLLLLPTLSSFKVSATDAITTSSPETTPPEPAESLPPLTKCRAGGVCNAETGEILYAVNRTSSVYPAAATKLMTALVVLEHYGTELDTKIKITEAMLEGASGVNVDLKAGETLTVYQLLACLVVASANDAAIVLSRNVAPTTEEFVAKMNEKAAELGMTSTEYRNPTGLHHKNMVTTVRDTLTLALVLYRNSEFLNLSSRQTFEIPVTERSARRLIHNRNYLVSTRVVDDYYDPTVNGMCYGSTYEAGGVCVASCEQSGAAYISVVFGGTTETVVVSEETTKKDEHGNTVKVPAVTKVLAHAFFEAKSLLDWAKASYSYRLLADTSDIICEVPVKLGDGKSHVTLFPIKRLELYLPNNALQNNSLRTEVCLLESTLVAPIAAGTVVGKLVVWLDDEQVAEVELVTRSSVDRSVLSYYGEQALSIINSASFRKWMLILFAFLAVYAVFMSFWRYRARKRALLRRQREKEEELRRLERDKLDRWQE